MDDVLFGLAKIDRRLLGPKHLTNRQQRLHLILEEVLHQFLDEMEDQIVDLISEDFVTTLDDLVRRQTSHQQLTTSPGLRLSSQLSSE